MISNCLEATKGLEGGAGVVAKHAASLLLRSKICVQTSLVKCVRRSNHANRQNY